MGNGSDAGKIAETMKNLFRLDPEEEGGKTVPEGKLLEGKEAAIFEVGVVVKDLDKAIEYLTSLGLGPFRIRMSTHPSGLVRGKKAYYKVRVAMSQQGPVQLQLIEYLEGETIFQEFLREKGEGLHHIAFKVRDLTAALARSVPKGMSVLQQDRFVGGGGLAHLNSTKMGGFIIKLIQHPPDFDPQKGVRYVERGSL
jgi:catechol 2,3-dioxygenase-like lactoylglutathione lyase family enzyme